MNTEFDLAVRLYITDQTEVLPPASVERIVLAKAMQAYDSASNGNKTRGGVKKANDLYADNHSVMRSY